MTIPGDSRTQEGYLCGSVLIDLVETQEDLSFVELSCSLEQCLVKLNPTQEEQVGVYTLTFRAYLEDYESVDDAAHKPADIQKTVIFEINSGVNDPPYFIDRIDETYSV